MYGRNQMGFGPPVTPQVIKNLIIANVVVFVAQQFDPIVTQLGAVRPYLVWHDFFLWQPFTYMWLHSPTGLMHIAFNMFALWMFGSALALYWGEKRFLRYYLTCGVGAGVLIATVPYLPWLMGIGEIGMDVTIPTLGASGAVMACLLAYAFTWPDRTIMLMFPPIPLKAIWLIPVVAVMEFWGPSNVSHVGHFGGMLVGWIYLANEGRTPGLPTIEKLKLRYKRYRMRQKIRAVHKESRREQENWRDDDPPKFH